jgi:hypothetical protein
VPQIVHSRAYSKAYFIAHFIAHFSARSIASHIASAKASPIIVEPAVRNAHVSGIRISTVSS